MPLLEPGDIIIDGGNSEYQDTQRRVVDLEKKGGPWLFKIFVFDDTKIRSFADFIISLFVGLLFVGCGVSGGEEGARYGPSMMPGGNPKAWPYIKPIFQASI